MFPAQAGMSPRSARSSARLKSAPRKMQGRGPPVVLPEGPSLCVSFSGYAVASSLAH